MPERKFTHVCSHCGKDGTFSILHNQPVDIDEETRQYAMLMCDSCNQVMMFIFERKKPPTAKNDKYRIHFDFQSAPVASGTSNLTPNQTFLLQIVDFEPRDFYPKRPYIVHETVPKNIANDYAEAMKCYDGGSYKATVAMCRRAMQGICKDKGADRKLKLQDQIDAVVSDDLQEYSHEIRHWGNIGGHPDEDITEVKANEARTMLEFIDLVFKRSYIYPYKLKKSKGRRGK